MIPDDLLRKLPYHIRVLLEAADGEPFWLPPAFTRIQAVSCQVINPGGGSGGSIVNTQTFTVGGVTAWNAPTGGQTVARIEAIGGGAGGGGGYSASSGFAGGGGGGGAGERALAFAALSDLPSTLYIVVGVGGAGGTPGNSGSADGQTVVAYGPGSVLNTICEGRGGTAGTGGSSSNAGTRGTNGALDASTGDVYSTLGGQFFGGNSGYPAGGPASFGMASLQPSGGGGGGSAGDSGAAGPGGAGGGVSNQGIANGGAIGANGQAGPASAVIALCGPGGGGGGGAETGNGGNGGNGANYGGGGGGGGGAYNGIGGTGGNGAVGCVRITCW